MKKLMSSLFTLVLVFMGIMLFTPSVFAEEPSASDSVDVTLTAVFDSENNLVLNELDLKYGDEITIDDFGTVTEYEFDFWIVNGVVRTDLPQATTFLATDDMQLTAVFHPANQSEFYVVFIDSNGHVAKAEFVEADGEITAPTTESFSKPGYVVSTQPWVSVKGSPTPDEITEASVFKLSYTVSSEKSFLVSVPEGATVSNETPLYNEVVTVESTDPEFVAWMENGQVVSFSPVYKFSALKDRELAILTDEALATPVVTLHILDGDDELRSGHTSYLGQVYLPEGATLIEWGILGSNTEDMPTYGAANVEVVKSTAIQPATLEFLRSIPDASDFEYVRAYAVVKFQGEIQTIYSFLEEEEVPVELIKLPAPIHGLGHQPRPVGHIATGPYEFAEGDNGGFTGLVLVFTNTTTGEVFEWFRPVPYKANYDSWYTELNLAAAGIVLTPGNYTIKYYAKGNGSTTSDSDFSIHSVTMTIAAPKLGNPVLTLDGTSLSWPAVANATSYEVYVNDVKTEFTSSPVDLSYLSLPATYTIKVVAKASGYDSGEATVNYVVASPEAQPLDAPTNLALDGDTLTWNAVPNAASYKITIGDVSKTSNTNSYDLTQFTLSAGTHDVTVQAISGNLGEWLNSNQSEPIEYEVTLTGPALEIKPAAFVFLNDPGHVGFLMHNNPDGNTMINQTGFAGAFVITITNSSNVAVYTGELTYTSLGAQHRIHWGGWTAEGPFKSLPNGQYTISIQLKAGPGYSNSAPVTFVTNKS